MLREGSFQTYRALFGENLLDRIGVVTSFACAAHCALAPFVMGILPLFGASLFSNPRTEWIFVATSFTVGLSSLLPAYLRRHKRARPILLFVIGLGLILTARLAFDEFRAELPFVIFGAIFVIASHVLNRKLCRACVACHDECGQNLNRPVK
jgi:hypothetical protein